MRNPQFLPYFPEALNISSQVQQLYSVPTYGMEYRVQSTECTCCYLLEIGTYFIAVGSKTVGEIMQLLFPFLHRASQKITM